MNNQRSFTISYFILLTILAICTNCGQYRILNQIIQSAYNGNVTSITTLSNERLAVTTDYFGRDWDITIYQGPKYTSYNNYFTISKQNKVILTPDDIIVGNPTSLVTKENKKIRQYVTTGISSSKMTVTKNYVLESQNQACPNLYYVDYNNWRNGTVFYQQGADCKFGWMGFVWDLKNGYVAYVAKFNLYIIQEATLNLYQKIISTGPYQYNGFIYSSAASEGQDSTVLVQGQRNYYKTFSRNPLTQQFQKNPQFHNPTGQIKLTGVDTGVSFQNTKIYYWRNIKKHVVSLEWNNKSLFFENMHVVAQYDQKDIVVLGGNNNLTFYKYNQNTYNLEFMYAIPLEFYVYEHEGAFTSNGETLVGRHQMAGSQWVFSVDVGTRDITYALTNQSKTANCTAHALINDNYVVTLCGVYVNYTVYQYQLQLRSARSLGIVDTVELPYVKNLPSIRIIASQAWDDYFAVLVRDTDGFFGDNCTTYIYRASGGIQNTSVTSNKLSYYRSIPWGKYIGSLKFYASNQPIPQESYLRIFKVSDLSLAYQTYNEQGIAQKRATVFVQKNLLIVQSYPLISGGLGYVYDINQPFENIYRGAYFRLHSQYSDWIVLPKYNLLYFFSQRSYQPYKTVYDILTPPIYKITSIFDRYVSVQASLYVTLKQFIPTQAQKCPLVFFVINTTLYKFRDCENSLPAQAFSLDPTGTLEKLNDPRLWIADDKTHLMIGSGVNISVYTLEIRSIYNPKFQLWSQTQKLQTINNANLLPSGLITYTTYFYIKFTNFYPIIQPSNNDMDKFIDYDSNAYGCIAFSGKNKTAPNETIIVYSPNRKLIPKYTISIDSDNVTLLSLHPQCKYLVAYVDSIMVTAYRVTPQGLKNTSYWLIQGVKSFKLMGNKLIIQTQHQVFIRDLQPKQGEEDLIDGEEQKVYAFQSGNYAVSNDGVYYAEGNDSTVKIKKLQTMVSVDEFTMQKGTENPIVTALTFSPTNQLFIATNSSNLLILTPTPCPNNLILSNFQCICSPTYILKSQTNTCICPSQKYQNNQKNQCEQCGQGKYITSTQDQCLDCSFKCSACVDQAGNCLSYSTGFILLIVGICVIAVAAVGVAVFCVIKKRRRALEQRVDNGSGLLTQDKNNSEYD